jgi:hypothetical protein
LALVGATSRELPQGNKVEEVEDLRDPFSQGDTSIAIDPAELLSVSSRALRQVIRMG